MMHAASHQVLQCVQKLTAEQRREAAKRYTLEQDTTRGSVAGAEKRKRLVRVSRILTSLAARYRNGVHAAPSSPS
jgi:hypothetical protein